MHKFSAAYWLQYSFNECASGDDRGESILRAFVATPRNHKRAENAIKSHLKSKIDANLCKFVIRQIR
jgi:hypothetical protein